MMNTKCDEVSDEELIGLNNVGNSTNVSQQWLNVRLELVEQLLRGSIVFYRVKKSAI